jgi:transcriptional regulator with XRE-family HTH domain
MAELGELIKSKRLARKWSLRQLGEEIGVTAAYVADIEYAESALKQLENVKEMG